MFLDYHDHFSNEVYQATACYVIWKNLQNQPVDDEELLNSLNDTPLCWIVFRHSVMQSLILALGRIFDTDGETISVDDLIKSCINEIDLFSKKSLRKRKQVSHNSHKWIDDYIDKAYEPSEKDFLRLKPEIKKYRIIYNNYYKPIRHNIFAHTNKEYHTKTEELWNATQNANMEEMLNFLDDLNITIREAYLNGRKPELSGRKYDEAWFERDILKLLNNVKTHNSHIL